MKVFRLGFTFGMKMCGKGLYWKFQSRVPWQKRKKGADPDLAASSPTWFTIRSTMRTDLPISGCCIGGSASWLLGPAPPAAPAAGPFDFPPFDFMASSIFCLSRSLMYSS